MKELFNNVINFFKNYNYSSDDNSCNEFNQDEIAKIDGVFNIINFIHSDRFSTDEFTNEDLALLIKCLNFYIIKKDKIMDNYDLKNERKLLYNLKIIYEGKTKEETRLNLKQIKVVYNEGKCYKCDGINLTKIKEDGTSFCKDCLKDIVVFEYIPVKDYKKMYDL